MQILNGPLQAGAARAGQIGRLYKLELSWDCNYLKLKRITPAFPYKHITYVYIARF